jgi:GGDEF domain-containing protein
MKKYINTRLANLLTEELEDSAVITQRNDHFVMLLPEVSSDEAPSVLKKLKSAAEDKLSLKLKVGVSTFPDRAVTFETLLEQAEAEMMQQPVSNNRPVELVMAEVKKMSSV